MEISINHELQCQALLSIRFAANAEGIHYNPAESSSVSYQISKSDPLPEGLIPGEFIYGIMTEFETQENKGDDLVELPIFYSTGS